jgi:hypothetical protein
MEKMKPSLALKILGSLSLALAIGFLCDTKAIQTLETAISGTIGAIVGGVLSALAFAFSIMSRLTKESLRGDSLDNPNLGVRYNAVICSLFADVRILIWCLAAAVFFPLYREIDIPIVHFPAALHPYITKSQIITGLEVFLVFVSISILFEVCDCMFQTFIADSISSTRND